MANSKPKQEINDLIFKELIKRGYALEGKTRVWNIADSKLWYLTPEQSQAFLNLEQSKNYQKDVIQKEIDLINENLNELIEEIQDEPVNIVDLGCGDGKKASLFIEKLKNHSKVRYCPVDISSYMVEKAMNHVSKMDVKEVVNFQWNISDFENIENIAAVLRNGEYKRNIYLLLGNTLGNFEINELLYEIRSSMKDGDFLLIGNGLDNRHSEEIIKAYENEQIDSWLAQILTQIGIKRESIKYGVRFRNSRIEEYYSFLEDIKIQFLGRTLEFNIGDQIVAAVSYKYNKSDFNTFLKMYFTKSEVFVSQDNSYALALCKK